MGWADIYDVKHTRHGDTVVIEVPEDFDVYSAPSVREAVISSRRAGRSSFVFDMSRVGYMDSTGLAVMVGALKWAREHDGKLAVACIGEPQMNVLRITGLTKLFTICGSVAEALDATRSTP